MSRLTQDLRFGLRMLVNQPGFTFVAVLTLALGIGANTAIFSVVNAIVFRPLPYLQAHRLVLCGWQWRPNGETNSSVTNTEYTFWKDSSHSFVEAAAYAGVGNGVNLAGSGEPVRVRGMRGTEGLLRVLGVSTARGRFFSPEEDLPNGPRVTAISDGLWRNAFGADPDIVGKVIQLDGESTTVVGVLPANFHFEGNVDLITPMQMRANPRDQGHNTGMIARLAPSVNIHQAQAEMEQLLEPFRQAYPKHIGPQEAGVRLLPYQEALVATVSNTLLLLFGAVGFVLLIACVNVANLLLARASSRTGEMAIRTALGASRARLLRQMLTESVLLAVAGGIAGVLVALWGVPLLLTLAPADLPRTAEAGVDGQAVLFALGLVLLTSFLFGLAPALRAARIDIGETLKAGAGRRGISSLDNRFRGLLVIGEVALALVLLIGAALLVQSFLRLRAVDVGFNPRDLTALQVSLTSTKYQTTAAAWRFQQQVLEHLAAEPGVVAVATSSSLPLERGLNLYLGVKGRDPNTGRSLECRPVSPGYFRTLGMTLQRGRFLAESDGAASTPVVVINASLARLFWSDEDPVGAVLTSGDQAFQVIGVVRDINDQGLDRAPKATLYMPMPQVPNGLTAAMNRWFLTTWLVRTSGAADTHTALRAAIRETDPQMPVASIRSMTDVMSGSIASQRFLMLLMGLFGGLALILTTVGIYGVLSYQVSQRTQEIGIRIALGARPASVLRLVVGRALGLALLGVVLGTAGAYGLTRLLTSLLFGVSATNPAAFVGVPVLMLAAAFAAGYIPARRATKVDPMIALRYE